MKTNWIEINIETFDIKTIYKKIFPIIIDLLSKYCFQIYNWHYLYEPEGMRVRFEVFRCWGRGVREIKKELRKKLKEERLDFYFGSHGKKGKKYKGEEELYGKKGFKELKRFLTQSSTTAYNTQGLEYKRDFYTKRYIHLFMNQSTYSPRKEFLFYLDMFFKYFLVWIGLYYMLPKRVKEWSYSRRKG